MSSRPFHKRFPTACSLFVEQLWTPLPADSCLTLCCKCRTCWEHQCRHHVRTHSSSRPVRQSPRSKNPAPCCRRRPHCRPVPSKGALCPSFVQQQFISPPLVQCVPNPILTSQLALKPGEPQFSCHYSLSWLPPCLCTAPLSRALLQSLAPYPHRCPLPPIVPPRSRRNVFSPAQSADARCVTPVDFVCGTTPGPDPRCNARHTPAAAATYVTAVDPICAASSNVRATPTNLSPSPLLQYRTHRSVTLTAEVEWTTVLHSILMPHSRC